MSKFVASLVFAFAAPLLLGGSGLAAAPDLFTGHDANGDGYDDNWVVKRPGATTFAPAKLRAPVFGWRGSAWATILPFPGGWGSPVLGDGQWVNAGADGGGTYTYRIAFDLCAVDRYEIYGEWNADNFLVGARLNGQLLTNLYPEHQYLGYPAWNERGGTWYQAGCWRNFVVAEPVSQYSSPGPDGGPQRVGEPYYQHPTVNYIASEFRFSHPVAITDQGLFKTSGEAGCALNVLEFDVRDDGGATGLLFTGGEGTVVAWMQANARTDSDGDGLFDDEDSCPDDPNADQADLDDDGAGDACDADADGDGFAAGSDCADLDPSVNPDAIELCGDDLDNDCDGAVDQQDATADCDGDGVPNGDDVCPDDFDPGQVDLDDDGLGDVCDADDDGDGVTDDLDNCGVVANADQADLDGDGAGDLCDDDRDGDFVPDVDDLCLKSATVAAPTQRLGTNRWADVDGDGVFDTAGKNASGRDYTMADTAGCSCAQIIDVCGYGEGHVKFGCSISVMDWWTGLFDQAGQPPFQCHE